MFKRTKGFIVGAALGSAVTYLSDPRQGRRRRAGLSAKATAQLRRARQQGAAKAHQAEGQALGAAARRAGKGQFRPEDDRDLADHLHGVLQHLDADTTDVNLEVVDGVVRVRGQVRLAAHRDRIMAAIVAEPAVVVADDLMHLPGQPAPNKAASLDAPPPAQ